MGCTAVRVALSRPGEKTPVGRLRHRWVDDTDSVLRISEGD